MTIRKVPRPPAEVAKERALAARDARTIKGATPDSETLNFAMRANLALQIVSGARNKKRKTASGMDPKAAMAQVQRQMQENGLRIVAVGTQDDDEGPLMGAAPAPAKPQAAGNDAFTQMLALAQGIDEPAAANENRTTLSEDIESIAAIDDEDAQQLERELLAEYSDELAAEQDAEQGIMLTVDEVLESAGIEAPTTSDALDLPPEPAEPDQPDSDGTPAVDFLPGSGLTADDMASMDDLFGAQK